MTLNLQGMFVKGCFFLRFHYCRLVLDVEKTTVGVGAECHVKLGSIRESLHQHFCWRFESKGVVFTLRLTTRSYAVVVALTKLKRAEANQSNISFCNFMELLRGAYSTAEGTCSPTRLGADWPKDSGRTSAYFCRQIVGAILDRL